MLHLIWPQLRGWVEAGDAFALATVTAVSGSGPRAPGACMAVRSDGRFIGSASSGCLDVVVIDAAREVLRVGGVRTLRFGPESNTPWSDGLTCGGWVEVRVEPWWGSDRRPDANAIGRAVGAWMEADESGIVISSGDAHGAFDAAGNEVGSIGTVDDSAVELARTWLREGRPPGSVASTNDGASVFIRTLHRRPRLVLVGAVDVAVHLVPQAELCGWRASVIDPRAAFACSGRFLDRSVAVVHAWPHEVVKTLGLGPRDAAIVLTHDPKIDDRALLALLDSAVGYLGALGSTRSHASRLERLGPLVDDASCLERIHGPAGIHLGAGDAAGIAVGMMAGLVQWASARDRAWLASATGR